MIQFFENNKMILMIILVVFVAEIIINLIQRKELLQKCSDQPVVFLSKNEYKFFCNESKFAISNTVISFKTETASDDQIVNKYIRTVNHGAELMRADKFKISEVGEV